MISGHQQIIRDIIVNEARSWKGTPYRHGCKEKGRGVDCAEFAVMPYRMAGIIPERKIIPRQGRTSVMDKDTDPDVFRRFIDRYAAPVPFDDRMPADLVTFYNLGMEHHVGIIVTNENMIDACNGEGVGRVRERRILKVKSLCGVYRPFCLLESHSEGITQLEQAIRHISRNEALEWKSTHGR